MNKQLSSFQIALATFGLAAFLAGSGCTEGADPMGGQPAFLKSTQQPSRLEGATPTQAVRAERPTPNAEAAAATDKATPAAGRGTEQQRPRPTYRTSEKPPALTPAPTPASWQVHYRDRVRNSCGPYPLTHWEEAYPTDTIEDVYGFTVQWDLDAKSIILDDRGNLIRVDSNGTQLQRIVDANPWGKRERLSDDSAFGFYGHLSHDGKKMVYATCEFEMDLSKGGPINPQYGTDYNYELAVKDLETGEVTRLTSNADAEIHPVWSPDSVMIAYLGDPDWLGKPASVIVISPAGTRITSFRYLKSGQYGEESALLMIPPVWSPDATKIAYKLEEGLGILDVATGTSRVLEGLHAMPGWSPDGTLLASTTYVGNRLYLAIADLQGRVQMELLDLTGFESPPEEEKYIRYNREGHYLYQLVNSVRWSPDGRYLLYRCPMGICVVDMEGNLVATTPEEYQSLEGQHWYAVWSPDGSRLAARKDSFPQEAGTVFLYTMNPDGSDPRVLVRGGLGLLPENIEHDAAEEEAAACPGHLVAEPYDNSGLVADCKILLKARREITPDGIVNWHPSVPMDLWAGVTISGEPARVRELSLIEEAFTGDTSVALTSLIPDELVFLDSLEVIRIHAFSKEEDRTFEQIKGLEMMVFAAYDLEERLWEQPNLTEVELRVGSVRGGAYEIDVEGGFKK